MEAYGYQVYFINITISVSGCKVRGKNWFVHGPANGRQPFAVLFCLPAQQIAIS